MTAMEPFSVLLLKVWLQLLQLLCQLNTALLQAGNVTINGSTVQLGKIGEQVARSSISTCQHLEPVREMWQQA